MELDLSGKIWSPTAFDQMLSLNRGFVFTWNRERLSKPYCINYPYNSTEPFSIVKRIGSESVNGEVYLLSLPGSKAKNEDTSLGYIAGKVMPIFNEKMEIGNKHEIRIAKKASDLVSEGKTTHFPLVYGSDHCEKTIYSENSKFTIPSKDWWIKKHIRLLPAHTQKRELILYDTKTRDLSLGEKVNYMQKLVPGIDINQITCESDILLSELAWGDLYTFINKYKETLSDENVIEMYSVILQIINDMQNLLKICHNDFHTGNILIINTEKGINMLAHDFGTAVEIIEEDGNDPYYTLKDIDTITGKLIEMHFSDNERISSLLYEMMNFIERLKREKTTDNLFSLVIQHWNEISK